MKRWLAGLLCCVAVVWAEPLEKFGLDAKMKQAHVPGVSIAIVEGGRIVWAKGFGVKTAGGSDAVTPETLFQAASISKFVAASGMLHLVQEGVLRLDEDVNVKLKSWKVPDNEFTREQKVTLRRLASHSAGLNVHGFPGYEAGKPLPALPQILNGLPPANTEAVRVVSVPGTKFSYSGGGVSIEQLLIQDVTGETFPEFMRKTVLSKIGMRRSTYEQPLPEADRTLAATGHDGKGEPITGKYHTYPEMAAAGLWTNPSELCKYALEIQNALAGRSQKILNQATVRQMLTVQSGTWGIGPQLSGEGEALRFGHGGANAGFRCQLETTARTGQGAAVMTNGDEGGKLAADIVAAVAEEFHWPVIPAAK